MKKKLFLIIILIFIIIIGVIIVKYANKKQTRACFKEYCFAVELAISPEERSRGLMFRESLDQDKGMLFIFEKEEKHAFWMKNTLIPLDIIWIDHNKEVIFIKNLFLSLV